MTTSKCSDIMEKIDFQRTEMSFVSVTHFPFGSYILKTEDENNE